MHSKAMAQTMSEEPCDVEFRDTFPPKRDGFISVENGFCSLETGKQLGNEKLQSGDNLGNGTGNCEIPEEAVEPETDLSALEEDPMGKIVPTVCVFPAIQGQTQCKSEEDDGYCSRSSLDSPVQTSHSDCEATDLEVFTLKDCSVSSSSTSRTGQAAGNADTAGQSPAFANTTVAATSDISSSAASSVPQPNGHQKIFVVNKTANVKYIFPTTSAASAPPLTQPVRSIPNLLNVQILKPDLSQVGPKQITLGVEEKKDHSLSSIPVVPLTSNGKVLLRSSSGADVGSGLVVNKESSQKPGSSGQRDVRHSTTLCGSLLKAFCGNTTSPSNKTTAPETAVVQQQRDELIVQGNGNSDVHLDGDTQQQMEMAVVAGGTATNSCAVGGGSDTEQIRPVDKVRDVSITCCNQILLAPENVSTRRIESTSRRSVTGAANCGRTEPGTVFRAAGNGDLQKTAKAFVSSSPAVDESSQLRFVARAAINGQPEVGSKSSTYQLVNRANQDVTVILLPQNSVQSITKKSNAVGDTPCKQVLLRTGQGQLFKAISVNSESLKKASPKVTEKLVHPTGDATKLILNATVRSAVIGTLSEGTANCLNCRDSTLTSKTVNGVVVGGIRSGETSAISGRQLLNLEKGVPPVVRSSNIGHFASLTLPGLQIASSMDSNTRGPGQSKPLTSSPVAPTSIPTRPKNQNTEATNPCAKGAETSNASGRSRISRRNIPSTRKSCHLMTSLHPLIDHDYCEFSAFCADVQSSIISLTESSIRPERRYVKKNRAARTKAMRVSQYASENGSIKNRPKRKYCKRKHIVDAGSNKKYGVSHGKLKGTGKVAAARSKGATGAVKDGSQSLMTSNKDYVKIPGYYQDEYVYYATKRLPGRPRNRAEAATKTAETVVAKQMVSSSGISVFDWYKEMAQTDKTTRFGVDCNVRGGSDLEEAVSGKDCTPVNESDVADLVMDMLPNSDLSRPISDDMKFMSTSIVESLLSNTYDLSALSTLGAEPAVDIGNTDLTLMAEEVRMMLSSMGEAELKILESHLENEKINDEMHVDGLDINSYLADYVTQENNMSQSSASNFLDVDDINDGDLLPADITNMNIILNDLKALNRLRVNADGSSAKLETVGIESLFDKGVNACDDIMTSVRDLGLGFANDVELSKTQNNADRVRNPGISISSSLQISSDPTRRSPLAPNDASPPELTTINMFWNDLPGLLMNGKEFVRLVDIHKQIMPAKDTGILKKRCHMMGLHITNCTELQRDFLIRYMNAAKSKSTVIIAKDAAIMLIGFYVNPKSRSRGADDLELDTLTPPLKQTKLASKLGRQLAPSASKPKHKDLTPTGDQSSTGSLPDKISVAAAAAASSVYIYKNESSGILLQPPAGESCLSGCVTGTDVKRSERLRHKHVSYSHMVHGGLEETEKITKSEDAIHIISSSNDFSAGCIGGTQSSAVLGSNLVASDQAELENLVREQKRRRLSLEEKLRLKLLRNSRSSVIRPKAMVDLGLRKARKRLMKRTKRTRRLLAWKRRSQNGQKNKLDLHTLEHCYAALPAPSTNSSKPTNFTEKKYSDHRVARNCNQGMEIPEILSQTASAPKDSGSTNAGSTKSNSVAVVHRDMTCRVNRRRRSQIGELVPHLYTSNDAPCIRCCNCHEMLSVSHFMQHMHWRRGSNKLVRVAVAQKLQLQSSARMPDCLAAWETFQKKRAEFESSPETFETMVIIGKEQPKTKAEPNDVKNAPIAPNTIPSIRHSSRVLKRKLLHPVEKHTVQPGPEVTSPGPDSKRHHQSTETDKRSSAIVGQASSPATSSVNFSDLAQGKKTPLTNGDKNKRSKKQRKRAIVQSDRLLRVTTRRSQDSRQTL